jgi:hypothetical protein
MTKLIVTITTYKEAEKREEQYCKAFCPNSRHAGRCIQLASKYTGYAAYEYIF